MARTIFFASVLMILAGCASYGTIDNEPRPAGGAQDAYSILGWNGGRRNNDLSLMLAFSGGGTRAANTALSTRRHS